MPAHYPIRAAAKLTGVAVETLRAWERRYHAVVPIRDGRGRLYGPAEIDRLILLRQAVESGHAIGQVAGLTDDELRDLHPAAAPAAAAGPSYVEPLVDGIQRCDSAAVDQELGRLAVLLPASDLIHRVVLPVMRLAGERWHNGSLHIAQEHLLSCCVRNLLGGLIRRGQPRRGAPRLLFTTPPGELHEFGILAAAMLASAHGLQVSYLGPNLPAAEVAFAARGMAPRVVVLGIMDTNATAGVRAEVARLAGELPPATELWIGGSGRTAAGSHLPNTVLLDDLATFEQHLGRLEHSQ